MKVTFVCESPDYRCHKMAKGLLATGECEPRLLAARWDERQHGGAFSAKARFGFAFWRAFHASWIFDPYVGRFAEPFAEPVLARMMSKEMARAQADVVHAITPPVSLSKLAIAAAKAPTVFDQYDLILQSYGEGHDRPGDIAHERWCFGHADGCVHKGPAAELDFYRERRYPMPGKELSLPDGCDDEMFQPLGGSKLSEGSAGLHVAYVGGIHGPGRPYYLLPEFEAMASQGVHVHIYPARWSRDHEDLSCYAKSGVKSGRIHVHGTMPYAELVRELSRYDFGLYYFDIDAGKFPSWAGKQATAAGNKIPTYYEAGLPVIVGEKLEYSAGIVAEDGAGLTVAAKDLDGIAGKLASLDMAELHGAVGRARERLSIKRQASALLDFYRKLA